jgi:hypothetical protein
MYQFHDTPSIGMKLSCYWDISSMHTTRLAYLALIASNKIQDKTHT